MKQWPWISSVLVAVAIVAAGCSSGAKGELSKQEVDALTNPQRQMPPEAVEAMRNAGANRPAIDPNMAPEAARQLAEQGGGGPPPPAVPPPPPGGGR
ncbi:MAG: hypothetical protein SNJ74_00285 [Fimbriimonadaceae bacterium]